MNFSKIIPYLLGLMAYVLTVKVEGHTYWRITLGDLITFSGNGSAATKLYILGLYICLFLWIEIVIREIRSIKNK